MRSKIKILKLNPFEKDYSEAVARLYEFEGWISEKDDVSKINTAIQNSFCSFGAFDESGQMVGFFRAFSDGVGDAYLLDLIVDPNFRKLGVAGRLVEAVLAELKKHGLDWITCISTPMAKPVYSKFGGKMEGFSPFRF
ncbi:MAG: GNAT family N-acetyltransferase [Opitutales bacterium]|nr:GNAT family N-acetyltransferase [Opitutales bacterium]